MSASKLFGAPMSLFEPFGMIFKFMHHFLELHPLVFYSLLDHLNTIIRFTFIFIFMKIKFSQFPNWKKKNDTIS